MTGISNRSAQRPAARRRTAPARRRRAGLALEKERATQAGLGLLEVPGVLVIDPEVVQNVAEKRLIIDVRGPLGGVGHGLYRLPGIQPGDYGAQGSE
jgi:hypothetical protein